jgi:hypothetical protein
MALSVTEIANLALSKLGPGGGYITAFDTDATVQAQAARRTYAAMRDLVLESHPWRFARKRAVLAASSTAPDWGYTTAYPVPSDFLRLLSTDTFEGDHEVEGGEILTSDYDSTESLNIRYLARIEDTSKFSPAFVDALATRWAAELAMTVTKSKGQREALLTEYKTISLPTARQVEGFGSASRREPDSDFLNSRL